MSDSTRGGVDMFYPLVLIPLLLLATLVTAIAGLFMWIGARLACVPSATFGRAIVAAVGSVFVSFLVAIVSGVIIPAGLILGYILGVIAAIFVIKEVFDTTFGKAFLVWIFHILAAFLALLIGL